VKGALEVLAGRWPPADEAIHEARKRLKKARAELRLLRRALGDRSYPRENRALRDAARPLSEVRDAVILVQAFDALVETEPSDRDALEPLREGLVAHQRQARDRVLGGRRKLRAVLQALRSARTRIDRWPLEPRGWSVLGWGVRRVFRSGRNAFVEVRKHPTPERLHEWRKQAKYLWHQLQVLEPIWPSHLARLGKRVHELSDLLGEDHDLVVLRQVLRRGRARVGTSPHRAIDRLIERRRRTVQAKATDLGAEVYDRPPRAFAKRLHEHWRRWRSQ